MARTPRKTAKPRKSVKPVSLGETVSDPVREPVSLDAELTSPPPVSQSVAMPVELGLILLQPSAPHPEPAPRSFKVTAGVNFSIGAGATVKPH